MNQKIISTILMITLVISMAGCGTKSEAVNTNSDLKKKVDISEVALEKIVVAEPSKGEHWLPIWLADELGFFKEEGLDVTFVGFNGSLVITSLFTGDSQFALTGYDQVLKTYDKGKSSKMIIATTDKHPWALVVSKDIKTFADLKNKKISAGMEGTSPRAFVRAALKSGGLDPNKDVEFVSLPAGSEISAMEKGEIAATFSGGITKAELVKRGYPILLDLADPEQHQSLLSSPYFHFCIAMTSDEYIKQHPENVQKFVNAVVKALNWQNSHSDQEVAEIIGKMYPNMNTKDLANVILHIRPLLSKEGYFTQEGHKAAIRMSMDVKMIKKNVDFKEVIDESFLKKAHEQFSK